MTTLSSHHRREFPAKVKLAAWERCKVKGIPHCERCNLRLVGRPIYDHDLPDGLQGEPTLENCVVSCRPCDRLKTYGRDIPMMAKADRIAKKDAGMKRKYPWPKRPFARWA